MQTPEPYKPQSLNQLLLYFVLHVLRQKKSPSLLVFFPTTERKHWSKVRELEATVDGLDLQSGY